MSGLASRFGTKQRSFLFALSGAFLLSSPSSQVSAQPPTAEVAPIRNRRPALTPTQQTFQHTLADVARTLKQMTARDWTVAPAKDGATVAKDAGGTSLQMILASSPLAPRDAVEKLKDRGHEPFVIHSDGKRTITIVANGEAGLGHGAYYYLDQLGARWFFPGDNWTIIPKRQDVSLKIDQLIAPAFINRRMFGTGGFGNVPFDREQRNKTRWNNWQRRNRFGSEFIIGGHSYGQFVQRHKEIFAQHPEYYAMVGGKRAVPDNEKHSLGAKFDVANPAVVKLYIADRLSELRKARALDPTSPRSKSISVEPSDGGGHCDSEECKKIGGPSELVFYLANEVAKAVAKEFPGAQVGLYAYNQHAAVPKFVIEPNVHVMVTPYGFNRTGLSPEQLIAAWAKKTSNLGMREYWSIPDWAMDMPSLNFVRTPAQKIRMWHRYGVNSLVAESSYSAGAVGPAWLVGSRLLWNPDADVRAILDDFYDKSFGPATPPIRRMLERWALGFRLISNELGLSFRDLHEAMKLAQDRPDVLARLDDYAGYLQFLRLRYELEMEQRGRKVETAELEPAMIAYIKHLNNIYDTSMVAVTRINQLLLSRHPDGEVRRTYMIWNNKTGEGWKERTPWTHADAVRLLADGAVTYRPIEGATTVNYEGSLTAVAKPEQKPGQFGPIMACRNAKFLFVAPAGAKSVTLKLSGPTPVNVTVSDAEGETIFFQTKTEGKEDFLTAPAELKIPITAAGLHRIEIRTTNSEGFTVAAPIGVPLIMETFQTRSGTPSPRLYFWVPRGLKSAALYLPFAVPGRLPRVFDGEGEPVAVQPIDQGKILIMSVAPGLDGKAWSVEGIVSAGKVSPQGLNVPHGWAFAPDTLIVPEDALK